MQNEGAQGPRTISGRLAHAVRDNARETLEGARDIGLAATGGAIDAVAGTASHTLKATAGVGDDLVSLTTRFWVHVIRGAQEVTAALGSAVLESARGGLRGSAVLGEDLGALGRSAAKGFLHGAGEVGSDLGQVAKQAALGFLHGSAEVGSEFGQLCKQGALGVLRGTAEVTEEFGTVAHKHALGTIQGGTETALSVEEALKSTALSFVRGVAHVRAEGTSPNGSETRLLESPEALAPNGSR